MVAVPTAATLMPRTARVAGTSVCGVSHTRDGLPNQDALALWQPAAQERGCIVAAVADGHGGSRHFRSATGSRFAVDAAVNMMRRFAAEWQAADRDKQTQIATSTLPEAIVADWSKHVREHLESTPITQTEWQTLEKASADEAWKQVQEEPTLAYGATLIAALVTSSQILLLQVGDGDAVLVAPDGTASHPIPADERLNGEFTTSICRRDAAADFRHTILTCDGKASLLMLATDGYSNSFRTDADFLQVGTDFLQMVRQYGLSEVNKQLPQILEHASANGSGDDITLALVHLGDSTPHAQSRGALPSTIRASEVRAELASLKTQVKHFRMALAAVALVAVVALGWTLRTQIEALVQPFIPSAAPETAPKTPPIETKPEPAKGSDKGSGKPIAHPV